MHATEQGVVNLRYPSLWNVVEQAFGVFKRRWRTFNQPHMFNIKTQVKLVYALVAVYNFVNKFDLVDEDFDRFGPHGRERQRR